MNAMGATHAVDTVDASSGGGSVTAGADGPEVPDGAGIGRARAAGAGATGAGAAGAGFSVEPDGLAAMAHALAAAGDEVEAARGAARQALAHPAAAASAEAAHALARAEEVFAALAPALAEDAAGLGAAARGYAEVERCNADAFRAVHTRLAAWGVSHAGPAGAPAAAATAYAGHPAAQAESGGGSSAHAVHLGHATHLDHVGHRGHAGHLAHLAHVAHATHAAHLGHLAAAGAGRTSHGIGAHGGHPHGHAGGGSSRIRTTLDQWTPAHHPPAPPGRIAPAPASPAGGGPVGLSYGQCRHGTGSGGGFCASPGSAGSPASSGRHSGSATRRRSDRARPGARTGRVLSPHAAHRAHTAHLEHAAHADGDASEQPVSGAREAILRRASHWAAQRVPYSMAARHDGWRADCSGFVSMAWGLDHSYTTTTLPEVSHRIPASELRPGDILLNTAPGAEGHVVLFDHWANAAHTAYVGYEQTPGGTRHHVIPYPYYPGHGVFLPYRLNRLGR